MYRRIKFAGILLGLGLPGALLGDPLGTLDQFCGGALSSVGCTETVASYPVEVGAVVAVIETEKSHLSGADDCKNKLGVGTALANEIAPYLNQVGGDVSQIVQCSCTIAYSSQTCSGEATKIADAAADAVSKALNALDGLLGLDVPSDHTTQEQEIENYFATVYRPLEPSLVAFTDQEALNAEHQLYLKCYDEWWQTNLDPVIVCIGFKKRFLGEVGALHSQYEAYLKGQQEVAAAKLQAQQDAIQAAKDAATDNARKIAKSWARIKHDTYVKQCHDDVCINGVTVVAFAYYGKLATGMQDLNSSDTHVLAATNAQFEPIFKNEIAKDHSRSLTKLATARSQVNGLLAPRLARLEQVRSVRSTLRTRLALLGVRNPDLILRRAAWLRAHSVPVHGLARRKGSNAQATPPAAPTPAARGPRPARPG